MAGIKLKINRAPKLGAPRFTRSEMREIVTAVRDAEVDRLHSGLKGDLTAAKPLCTSYAISKSKKLGTRAVRDWRLKNDLPGSLRVTVSSPELGIIKFPADTIRTAMIREQQDEMFSLSARGEAAGMEVAKKYLEKALKRAAS